jgi:hypothetical protein
MRPSLTHWPPGTEGGAVRFLARRFTASQADLDVDFHGTPRVTLVTCLLELCLHGGDACSPLDVDQVWRWSAEQRLQGLLAIALATCGPTTAAIASCGHPDCGRQMELELLLESFVTEATPAMAWKAPDGRHVRCHLPNGADQLAWYQQARHSGSCDERWLARRLIDSIDEAPVDADWTIPQAWLEPLASLLDEHDPLTALTVRIECPFCACQNEIEVDLEQLLISNLHECQRALLNDVHRLACAYHWNEAEIVALAPWRRARYLSRVEAQLT